MALLHFISIEHDFTSILSVNKKNDSLLLMEDEVIETDQLKDYLRNKKNFYICATQDDVLSEEVTIPSLIKNDRAIKGVILNKLKHSLSSKDVLLNYTKLSEDEKNATTTYNVVGVYEKEYLKMFEHIHNTNEIKSATISRYALFALSQECLNVENYLCVYTQSNKIMILAVEKNHLVGYIRASSIIVDNPMERHKAMVEEINRTIAYITQQYRDIKFSVIALSGSIAIDDAVCADIAMLSDIPIAVLYPNTIIQGLEDEEPQHAILALGNYFVHKKLRFIPNFLIASRQYSLALNISFTLSIVTFFTILFFAYGTYSDYNNALTKYEKSMQRLLYLIQKTNTYSDEDLKKSLRHIDIAKKYLKYYPSDTFTLLKPLLQLLKPEQIDWNNREENRDFAITFKQQFHSLESLYKFEKNFHQLFHDLDTSLALQLEEKTDYKLLLFHTIVKTEQESSISENSQQRRRRAP